MRIRPNFTATAALIGAILLVASHASAQITPYTLTLDESRSFLRVSGDVSGFNISGDLQANFGGTMNIRVDRPHGPFRGFIIDASNLVQLDPINGEIDNPFPFLPPLGTFRIDGMVWEITSGVIRLNAEGRYATRSGRLDIIAGVFEGEVLDDPFYQDLAGMVIDPMPLRGEMGDSGSQIYLYIPIDIPINRDGANLRITGQMVATLDV